MNHTWLLFCCQILTHKKCTVDSVGISCVSFLFYSLLSLSSIGLLYVRQVPHLNCLASKLPDHKDLAFKLKRKQFTIEVRCQGYSAYPGCLHKQNIVFSGSSIFNAGSQNFFVLFCCPNFIPLMCFL